MLQTARMPDDVHPLSAPDYRPRPVTVTVSAEGLAARLDQLPTRKEMYRAVLLAMATGACLVQCLAWLFQ
jgi:hypothetical protein